MALTFTMNTKVLKAQTTAAGVETYEGGELHDANRQVGVFTIVNETITSVTDDRNLDTAMVWMQLFMFDQHQAHGGGGQGGGGGGGGKQHAQAPESLVLQGSNEFIGPAPNPPTNPPQARQTARAIGSVSAATQAFASHIGKQFVRVGDKLTIG